MTNLKIICLCSVLFPEVYGLLQLYLPPLFTWIGLLSNGLTLLEYYQIMKKFFLKSLLFAISGTTEILVAEAMTLRYGLLAIPNLASLPLSVEGDSKILIGAINGKIASP
jgi:hypothetical protein